MYSKRELAKLLNMAASLEEIGKQFTLTQDQLEDPNCGIYIVDRINQIQTAYNIRKGLHDRVDFPKTNPLGGDARGEEKTDAERQ